MCNIFTLRHNNIFCYFWYRIIHAFDSITEDLIQQVNFIAIGAVTEDVALQGKRVSNP